MLERLHLENFKASRDLDARLAPLTLLAGVNSSGKSTLLQAIGALKQSYDPSGRYNGLSLSGHLVQLGRFADVLSQGGTGDTVVITITEGGQLYRWAYREATDDKQLPLSEAPAGCPAFITSTDFQFLQADRIVPRTLYPQASQRERASGFLGARGEYTVDFLARSGDRPVEPSRAFPKERSGLSRAAINKAAPTASLLDQVAGWLQLLSPGVRLNASAVGGTDEVLLQFRYDVLSWEASGNYYRPTNVGFGLTYCLPILVACLAAPRGALLLLENPEAHLHPQGQSALGELLSRCANDGTQIVVETHSDHLLNGVRLAVKRELIRQEDVAVHFFSRSLDTGESFIQTPAILRNGRLSNWPQGFFDQWDKDIDALLE